MEVRHFALLEMNDRLKALYKELTLADKLDTDDAREHLANGMLITESLQMTLDTILANTATNQTNYDSTRN